MTLGVYPLGEDLHRALCERRYVSGDDASVAPPVSVSIAGSQGYERLIASLQAPMSAARVCRQRLTWRPSQAPTVDWLRANPVDDDTYLRRIVELEALNASLSKSLSLVATMAETLQQTIGKSHA